jgi:hypothetical protein
VAHRSFEPLLIQDRRVDEARKRGLARADLFRLAPDLAPDRIVVLDIGFNCRDGFRHRNLAAPAFLRLY